MHAAGTAAEFGGLGKFSGEALEKKNDEVKQTLLRQTNHRDVMECIKIEKRREKSVMETEKLEHDAKSAGPNPKKAGCQHP